MRILLQEWLNLVEVPGNYLRTDATMITQLAAVTLGGLGLLSAPLASPPSSTTDEQWYDDFDVAVAAAKEQGKDLFVDFTGSDWCGWCIRLHKEVFAHDEWLDEVRKHYVLVSLDFPKAQELKDKVPNPKRNEQLSGLYEVEGFPTILLLDSDGDVFGRTGYQAGGPTAYLKHMRELRDRGRPSLLATKKVIASFNAAEGQAKWAEWDKALARFESGNGATSHRSLLSPVIRWALKADAGNSKGAKERAIYALLKARALTDEVIIAAADFDPKNEKGILDALAKAIFITATDERTIGMAFAILDDLNEVGFKSTELAFVLNIWAADWCDSGLAYPERVKQYAQIAQSIGTSDKELQAKLDRLLQ